MAGMVREMSAVTRLATPIAAAHLGQMLLGFVDTAVVGRLGETELAAVGLGNAIYYAASITGAGCMLGLDPLISQAIGSGRPEGARATMWQGVWLALFVAVPSMVMAAIGILGLEAMGIAAETARLARHYLFSRLGTMVPYFLVTAVVTYLQASDRTRPLIISAVITNVVNAPLDVALVFGDEALDWAGLPAVGLPALGVAGAGLTSTLVTVVQLGIVVLAARAAGRGLGGVVRRPQAGALREALAVGFPVGMQRLAEMGVFSATTLLMGRIGTLAAASHQIALSFAAATFMVPLGISSAAAVRVGRAVGAGDQPGVRHAGFASLLVGTLFMAAGALLFVAVPRPLIAILTDDPEVQEVAVPLMRVAAIFQVSDGLQVVAGGALRGMGDTRAALYYNLVGHYLVGVPVGLGLAFVLDQGAVGLWWGLCAGLTAVGLALSVRFARLSKRPVRPISA